MSNEKRNQQGRGRGHGPMAALASTAKAKDFKGSFKRLWGYLKPHKIALYMVIAMTILSVAFSISGPKVLGNATNKLFGGIVSKAVTAQIKEMNGGELPKGLTKDRLVTLIAAFNEGELKENIDAGNPITKEMVLKAFENDEMLYNYIGGMFAQSPNAQTDAVIAQQFAQVFSGGSMNDMLGVLKNMDAELGQGIDFKGIALILLAVLALYAVSSVFSWAQSYIIAGVTQKTVYGMRRQIDEKLSRLPLKYFDSNSRGDILSRVTNDVDNIQHSLQQSMNQVITAVFTVIGIIIMMFWISPALAAVSIIMIPVCLFAAMQIAKRSQKHFKNQWASTGALNGQIEETHTGHNIVKVFGREKEAVEAFDEENEKLYKSSFKAQFISGIIMPVMNFFNNINYVIICIFGGIRVAGGNISFGDVQAFIQYSRQLNQPITQTASLMNVIQSAVASAERVFELLDEPEQEPDSDMPVLLEKSEGHVIFENVDFRYKEETPLISGLNLEVKPGQTVAIVGPTGAGKTTLVNLLMRFYELDAGRITIDGVDIKDMTREGLRGLFGMVLQDAWLFSGTIRDNIAYGAQNPNEDEIIAASKAAYSDRFIRTLPDGYDTILADDATNISQGQRQLMTIARAFLSDPQILILDEATSSVDTRTEVMIQKAMARLMKSRTSFIIAHRLSTIRDADVILVMNEGNVIEQGDHQQLMQQKGFYYDMFMSQFAGSFEEAVG